MSKNQGANNGQNQHPHNWNNEDIEAKLNGSDHSESDAKKPSSAKEEDSSASKLGYTLIVLLIIGGGTAISHYWNTTFSLNQTTVSGNYYTTTDQILEAANIPAEINPDSISYLSIIERIEAIPYIKTAAISPNPPEELLITVTERRPLALLIEDGNRTYVDAQGVQLPVILSKTPDVPFLYGFNSQIGDTLSTDEFSTVSTFLVALDQNPLSNTTLSEIASTEAEGIVAMSRENGVKVIFGKKRPDQRLANWEAFYKQIVPKTGMQSMAEIDLRYEGQVITRTL